MKRDNTIKEVSRITFRDIQRIKKEKMPIIEMQHAIRLNGCVDIWMNGHKLYDKQKNEYLNFENKSDLIKKAIVLAHQYGEVSFFKKNNGKMTYKEFKHNKKQSRPEYYHWSNNKTFSESSLYFIKCGIYIKVGKSKDVKKRLATLKTGMPMDAKILGEFKGMGHLEYTIQRCFEELKTKKVGEWFYYDNRFKDFIEWAKKAGVGKGLKKHISKSSENLYDANSTIPFGKYKGNKIRDILNKDLQYIKWLSGKINIDEDVFSTTI